VSTGRAYRFRADAFDPAEPSISTQVEALDKCRAALRLLLTKCEYSPPGQHGLDGQRTLRHPSPRVLSLAHADE
jgi:hypothetical protein